MDKQRREGELNDAVLSLSFILFTVSQRESRKALQMKSMMQGDRSSMREKGVVSRIEESSQVERDITDLENNPTETPHEREKSRSGFWMEQ